MDTEKTLEWLDRLREGVTNQNHEAERAAAIAMDSANLVTTLQECERALSVHIFMPSEDDRDTCASCGQNFRDSHHLLTREGSVANARNVASLKARAAIAKARGLAGRPE